MKASYEDITSRIQEAPKWYDANGTPRYGEFKPEMLPDIYANVCVLFQIRCQFCPKRFVVELHEIKGEPNFAIEGEIKNNSLHYGDPPSHECSGDSANCLDLFVIGYWELKFPKGSLGKWREKKIYKNYKLDDWGQR